MIRKSGQFVKKNKFSIALWTGILALLFLSTFQKSYSFQGFGGSGGSGGDFCNLVADIDDFFCGTDDARIPAAIGEASIRFEPNVGQADSQYGFIAHGREQAILLSSAEAVFQLKGSRQAQGGAIHASLEGARGVTPKPEQPLSGRVNYLIGRDPKNWHTDIPTFASVRFPGVYPGVDVIYHGNRGDLETDFEVQPGGDPEVIRIRYSGADVRLESDGSLTARAPQRTLSWKKPVMYQIRADGVSNAVEGRFKMTSDGSVGFEVGVYDIDRPLIIDPVLTYATYFGTAYADGAARVAADASGNAYIVGSSDATQFPSTPGAFFSPANGVQGNVVVAKLSPSGSMVYETHIGGSNGDLGWGLALDSSGNVYLAGMTASGDFPLLPATNNLTTKLLSDPMNCFVSKLNSAGNALIYSMIMGGSSADGCSSIGVDSTGNAYVTGVTTSTDLPTVSPIQSSLPGALFGTNSTAAFIMKLNPTGTSLLYSTYFGGPGNNAATSLAVDSAGNAYFTGFTTSYSFPVSSSGLQTTFGGTGGQNNSVYATGDAFVVKLNPSGQKVYATYLGGRNDDIGVGIAIDAKGDAYIGGATLSTDFPTQNAFQSAYAGAGGDTNAYGGDGFVTELDPTGSKILFSSYIGGSMDDRVLGIALDPSGNIYVAGHTISADFPIAGQPAQATYAGDNSGVFHTGDAFVAEISTSHTLTYSTYLGGSGGDWASGVAVDGTGAIIAAGGTSSSNFPTTAGAYQAKYAGTDSGFASTPVGDAFIARFGGANSGVSISSISNAASYVGGGIAPGEAVYISGTNIGPATLVGAALDPDGDVSSSVASTQFLFNGIAAPIVYVSATQSSVIVPYEVSTATTAQVVAVYNGIQSPPVTVPVVTSLPGIFSANSSGTGQGAIFNQDISYNSAQNPAARGSQVVLFLTGEGQTSPPGIDGSVTASQITPALPVTVTFGTVPAPTPYAFVGEAPSLVAGVLQINVVVPANAPTGNVPVTVTIGSASSQSGLTVAIK